jgi:hypothetical protein
MRSLGATGLVLFEMTREDYLTIKNDISREGDA